MRSGLATLCINAGIGCSSALELKRATAVQSHKGDDLFGPLGGDLPGDACDTKHFFLATKFYESMSQILERF